MVLSTNDKRDIRDRVKKRIEALKAKTTPITPPKEVIVEETEKT